MVGLGFLAARDSAGGGVGGGGASVSANSSGSH